MHVVLVALLLFVPLLHAASAAAQGNVEAGKNLWTGIDLWCQHCHGPDGDGGFGPDLAGRQLTFDQFRHAVREPWGIMPAYTEEWLSDQDIANLVAYLDSLPGVREPGSWRISVPPGAPPGQELLIAGVGCGQCHGADMGGPRMDIGAIDADFEWFKKQVYEHTTVMPEHRQLLGEPNIHMRMGNYSRMRLPESVLEEMWRFTVSLGPRADITGVLDPPVLAGSGVTYPLTVANIGLRGKGVTAEDVAIVLTVAPGFTVTNASGPGYQGVRRDPRSNAETAVWHLPRLAPQDSHTYSITFSGSGAGAAISHAEVQWAKPVQANGRGDRINVFLPRPPQVH